MNWDSDDLVDIQNKYKKFNLNNRVRYDTKGINDYVNTTVTKGNVTLDNAH